MTAHDYDSEDSDLQLVDVQPPVHGLISLGTAIQLLAVGILMAGLAWGLLPSW